MKLQKDPDFDRKNRTREVNTNILNVNMASQRHVHSQTGNIHLNTNYSIILQSMSHKYQTNKRDTYVTFI